MTSSIVTLSSAAYSVGYQEGGWQMSKFATGSTEIISTQVIEGLTEIAETLVPGDGEYIQAAYNQGFLYGAQAQHDHLPRSLK